MILINILKRNLKLLREKLRRILLSKSVKRITTMIIIITAVMTIVTSMERKVVKLIRIHIVIVVIAIVMITITTMTMIMTTIMTMIMMKNMDMFTKKPVKSTNMISLRHKKRFIDRLQKG